MAVWRACRAILLLPCLLLGACSSVDVVNALVPHDDYQLMADQPYGAGDRRKLDIYLPKNVQGKPPVAVFFYGGNWDSGQKKDYRFVGEALASRGIIAVLADYRVYPEVKYPAFLEDGAQAVKWTLDHVDALGGDPSRVSLVGHSAGAYIAAYLALDKKWLGADRARIHSVVGMAGPYDFLPLTDPTLKIIFGTESDLELTQPIHYVDGTAPPFLLMAGRKDTVVLPKNSVNLAARIKTAGGQADEIYYDDLTHITLIGAMARPLRYMAPVLDDVSGYLKR
jgi:acetyl esterase/lipase